jgi:hypothetical protein
LIEAKKMGDLDEVRRLTILRGYGVSDTAPEPEFDELAKGAHLSVGAPIEFMCSATVRWSPETIDFAFTQAHRFARLPAAMSARAAPSTCVA